MTIPAPAATTRPRKKHRIFWWLFLAVQIAFIIWIIAGTHSNLSNLTAHSAADCKAHDNYFFGSLQDCINGSNGATEAGNAIGVGLVIALWVAADIILGIGRFVWITARRRQA